MKADVNLKHRPQGRRFVRRSPYRSDPEAIALMMRQILRNQETAIVNFMTFKEPGSAAYDASSDRLVETRNIIAFVETRADE